MFANLFIFGLLAHFFADWFLQNDWQARHKTNLRHPAAFVHFGCHLACLSLAWFPVCAETALPVYNTALAIWCVCVSHALIDTRKPLVWWRSLIGQKQYDTQQEPGSLWNQAAIHVAFWQDQAAHILVLGFSAGLLALKV